MIEEDIADLCQRTKNIEKLLLAQADPAAIALLKDQDLTQSWLELKSGTTFFRVEFNAIRCRNVSFGKKTKEQWYSSTSQALKPWLDQLAESGYKLEIRPFSPLD